MMDLILEFNNGVISGEGHDGVGGFVIAGHYSPENHECDWKKTYVGKHTVNYHGFRENKGIWGTWQLPGIHGGFQIWPLSDGTPLTAAEEADSANKPEMQTA
jgi:hypothetical protein